MRAHNGKIYGIPDTAKVALVIDSETDEVSGIDITSVQDGHGNKWSGGVLNSKGDKVMPDTYASKFNAISLRCKFCSQMFLGIVAAQGDAFHFSIFRFGF